MPFFNSERGEKFWFWFVLRALVDFSMQPPQTFKVMSADTMAEGATLLLCLGDSLVSIMSPHTLPSREEPWQSSGVQS